MSLAGKYGLPTYRKPTFSSNGKSISFDATEYEVIDGTGEAMDYPAFPDLAIDASNYLHVVFRNGSDHNSTNNAGVAYTKSTDNGVSWSSPVEIVPSDESFLITNESIMISSTGRIIVVYNKQSGSNRDPFFIYSDNSGTSWSTEAAFSTEYAEGQVAGVSGGIEDNGTIVWPFYGTYVTGQKRNAVLFSSTDNGASWDKFTNITPSGLLINGSDPDFEEPVVRQMQSGLLVALLRSDPSPHTGTWFVYSYNGVNWSWPVRVINSRGKNSLAVSPNGTLLSVGRDSNAAEWRTIVSYSSDSGKSWTTQFIDSREGRAMYSGCVWSPAISKWVVVYATETGTENLGPTIMVCKHISEV